MLSFDVFKTLDFQVAAIIIAMDAHDGQFRHDNVTPYITHPITVAAMVENNCKAIAYLHDVLEDSNKYTTDDLHKAGIPQYVIDAVVILTKTKGEDYQLYLQRVKANEYARKVKIADIQHNLSTLDASKPIRREKYVKALVFLRS